MIQQRIGDLLEIHFEGRHYYVVVLTKIVMFGGNVVFAFHTDGGKLTLADLDESSDGFNVCTDLLMAKREGSVLRLHRFSDTSRFWRTRYMKRCFAYRPTEKATEWFISRADDPDSEDIARVRVLSAEYRAAMDAACSSFDLVAEKILRRYTPDQNEHI
jgi:hypothetical protein